MPDRKEMFDALHPDPTKNGTRVTKATYEIYREALLKIIPSDDVGIPFSSLKTAVQPYIPADVLANTSPGWWVTTVKLDLEARSMVKRLQVNGRQNVIQCS